MSRVFTYYITSIYFDLCRFVKGQDDLVRLVKNQEKRHDINRREKQSGELPDLCDLLQDSIPYDEQQVSY